MKHRKEQNELKRCPRAIGRFGLWSLAILSLLCMACGQEEEPQLDVYNWPYYISDSVLSDFEEEYDCRINYREFATNEDLYAAIKSDAGDWDVIFPSDYMVEIMASESLISEIDKSKISNISNIEPDFLGLQFDPENRYSLPYIWGTTGIGYNSDKLSEKPDDYDVLWEDEYRGRIGLLDDMRFVIAIPLLWRGYSINTTSEEELQEAEELLVEQKDLVKVYNSENYVELLTSGQVDMFYGYSGDIIQAIPQNDHISFFIPESGGVLYVDNMCIPASADEKGLAHAFIDYLLRPDVAARIINERWFAMPNKKARPLVNENIRSNPGVYPPPEILSKLQQLEDLGEERAKYEKVWQSVKGQ